MHVIKCKSSCAFFQNVIEMQILCLGLQWLNYEVCLHFGLFHVSFAIGYLIDVLYPSLRH